MPDKAYPYIYAWGEYIMSFPEYVEHMVKLAQKQNAPDNAVFLDEFEKWITYDQLKNQKLKDRLAEIVERRKYQ